MPVKKSVGKTVRSPKQTPPPPPMVEETPPPVSPPMPTHPHHPHHLHKYCGHFGKKLIMTLVGILLVYLTIFLGTLIRNELKAYDYIGLEDRMERTIMVEATGTVEVKPDVANITMGVSTQKETVAEAQAENTEIMNKLIARVKELGIPEGDIQTANYDVYPNYDWTAEEGSELIGYEVSQSVTIKMRDIEMSDQVIGLAGELGITDVGQLDYTVDDKDIYLAEAREDALKKISVKARGLSRALGVRMVGIISYDEYEGGDDMFGGLFGDMASGFGMGEAMPTIEAGTDEIVLNVSVTFEIR